MDRQVMRIIDANLNRLTEGLRVVEDVLRYARDDAPLQQKLKSMRHRASSAVPAGDFLMYRNAAGDVGLRARGSLENRRGSLGDVVRANLKRAQEACRVLEEVLKIESPGAALVMKELRYESYGLENELELRERRRPPAGLFLVMRHPGDACEDLAGEAVAAKVPAVVLGCPGADARLFYELARSLKEITRGSPTRLLVEDRVDVALAAGADGIHLGKGSLPPKEARALAGDFVLLGLSADTLEEVERAQGEPVDYLVFGPASPGPSGAEEIRQAAGLSRLPVVARCAVNAATLPSLAGTPLQGVACTPGEGKLGELLQSTGEII